METLHQWLETRCKKYNQAQFIESDPIQVPHQFSKLQDIEIAGFFAAIIAWGKRGMIIKNAKRLMSLMDNAPHDFILHHTEQDLAPLQVFVHRTFQPIDLMGCIAVLQRHYQQHTSLESAFAQHLAPTDTNIEQALRGFHQQFFADDSIVAARTAKHVSTPAKGSACKRLCMYLRWLVRNDGVVDLGIWQTIKPSQLIIPLDVHVGRQARALGLLNRAQMNWNAAVEITSHLRQFDALDPVKYDFALFGAGVSSEDIFE